MDYFDINIFAGNLGSGKTTAGRRLERAIGAEFIDPDYIRRDLGITDYDPADTPRVMGIAAERLQSAVTLGKPVALCSAFIRQTTRESYYGLIDELSEELGRRLNSVLVWCECSETGAKKRIAARGRKDHLHCPPNDPAAYDRMKAIEPTRGEFESLSLWPNISYLVLNTELLFVQRMLVRPGHDCAIASLEPILLGKMGL